MEKLKKRLHGKDMPEGFLVKTIEKYMACFGEIKRQDLLDLLKSDLNHW